MIKRANISSPRSTAKRQEIGPVMKLIVGFVVFLIMGAVLIKGISAYLGPDGLSQCQPYPSTEADCQSVDAIVAISGGDTEARTAQAIDLYKHDWAPLLVFSGAAADKSGPSNAEASETTSDCRRRAGMFLSMKPAKQPSKMPVTPLRCSTSIVFVRSF